MNGRSGGSRQRVWLALGALLVLGVLGWLALGRSTEPPPSPPSKHAPRPVSVEAAPVLPPSVAPTAPTEDTGTLRLQATLSPAQSGRPFKGQAWVGPVVLREEGLATVDTWLPAPVTPSAGGGGQLGPVEVPPAMRYRLLAWEPEGTFYWEDFLPGSPPTQGVLDAGVLRARSATGLRIRLTHAPPGQTRYVARLERIADESSAAHASELLPVMELAAPELAMALRDEAFLPLSTEEDTLFLPLLPDRAVRLWLQTEGGLQAEPWEVPLREGQVETVVVDLGRAFPGGGESFVDLRGQVLLGDSSRPPPGATLELLGAPEPRTAQPGPDGSFTFEKLPAWRPSRILVRMEPPTSGRPMAPPQWEFDFTPGPGPHVRPEERTWRVPAYQWLVLTLDASARGQLEGRAQRPYPVYMLQRKTEGQWRMAGPNPFLQEAEGVAVPLMESGTYRVLAAVSPSEVYESAPVEVREGESRVSLSVPADGVPCAVQVVDGRTGAPVSGARVLVAAGQGGLPPVQGRTDVGGRWELGRLRGSDVYLQVESDMGHWEGAASAACLRTGRVDVRL